MYSEITWVILLYTLQICENISNENFTWFLSDTLVDFTQILFLCLSRFQNMFFIYKYLYSIISKNECGHIVTPVHRRWKRIPINTFEKEVNPSKGIYMTAYITYFQTTLLSRSYFHWRHLITFLCPTCTLFSTKISN